MTSPSQSSTPPSLFLTVVGFALSRAFLFGLLNTVLLLVIKSYATYISALNAPSTGSADGWVGFFLPFFCLVGIGIVFAMVAAALFVGNVLGVLYRNATPNAPPSAIVALLISFIPVIPFQFVAYYHLTNTVNDRLTEGTDYVAYYLLPSIFIVVIGWLTYRRVTRFIATSASI